MLDDQKRGELALCSPNGRQQHMHELTVLLRSARAAAVLRVWPGALATVEAAAPVGHGELATGLPSLACMGTTALKPRKGKAGRGKRTLLRGQRQHPRRHGLTPRFGAEPANSVELNG